MFSSRIFVVVAVSLMALWVLPANAVTIFSGTGQDLFNDPNASFPTRTPSVSGTSLVFGIGSVERDQLVRYPLFLAGTFSGASGPVEISISVNLTRLTTDSDNTFNISDGSDLVAGVVGDNLDGTGNSLFGTDNGTTIDYDPASILQFTGAGFPGIGQSLDAQINFSLEQSLTTVGISFGSDSGSSGFGALDRAQALTFIFGGGNAAERYQINSLTITAIPEPATALLLGMGLVAMSATRRRLRTRG